MISIVMPTYFIHSIRVSTAIETLYSWQKYLKYDGEINLVVSDDGSALNWYPENIWKGKVIRTRQERRGLGASLNKGFQEAFKLSPLGAYFVDDWKLIEPLDINSWCKALIENETVGCVRLGPPHPYLTGRIEMISNDWQGWALRLNKGGYAYGDRPALYHRRFFEDYGWFEEKCSALECVRLYDEKVSRINGCDIVLALPHKFIHLDSISLSEIEP